MFHIAHRNGREFQASQQAAFQLPRLQSTHSRQSPGEGLWQRVGLERLGESAAKQGAPCYFQGLLAQPTQGPANDREDQLTEQPEPAPSFLTAAWSFHFIPVSVQMARHCDMKEEFPLTWLCCWQSTKSELYKTVKDCIINKCGLAFTFCGGACSEGAGSIVEFETLIKSPHQDRNHCAASLLRKSIDEDCRWNQMVGSVSSWTSWIREKPVMWFCGRISNSC